MTGIKKLKKAEALAGLVMYGAMPAVLAVFVIAKALGGH